MDKYGISKKIDNVNRINNDFMNEIRWITARKADSIMLKYINTLTYHISILSQYDIHKKALSVPLKFRKSGMLQLNIIKYLFPDLLEIPIFSHCSKCSIDKSSMTLRARNFRKRVKNEMINKINGSIYLSMRKIYRNIVVPLKIRNKQKKDIEFDSEKMKIVKEYISDIQKDSIKLLNIEKYQGRIDPLITFAQYLNGLRIIRSK